MDKILCVEDSPDACAVLEATLYEHDLVFASTIAHARQLIQNSDFWLALLDIELPDGSGLELISTLGQKTRAWSIFFLTAKTDLANKSGAFALGADDYIVKPFDPNELRLRVNARQKKHFLQLEQKTVIQFASLTADLLDHRVRCSRTNEWLDLTNQEFRILAAFLRTPNKVFSRNDLFDHAWGPAISVSDRAIDVHISNIRKKLAGSKVSIEAVIGYGYQLTETK